MNILIVYSIFFMHLLHLIVLSYAMMEIVRLTLSIPTLTVFMYLLANLLHSTFLESLLLVLVSRNITVLI